MAESEEEVETDKISESTEPDEIFDLKSVVDNFAKLCAVDPTNQVDKSSICVDLSCFKPDLGPFGLFQTGRFHGLVEATKKAEIDTSENAIPVKFEEFASYKENLLYKICFAFNAHDQH